MKQDTYSFNRVLFGSALPFRRFEFEGGFGYEVDGSALPYFVEELIACSALEVAIPSHHHAVGFVDELPTVLKNRVKVVDSTRAVTQRDALLSPVLSELGVSRDGPGLKFPSSPAQFHESISHVFDGVEYLLLGMDAKLEIDIDIERLADATSLLRSRSSDATSRANLAILEGILNSYVRTEVPSLVAVPRARAELVEMFSELVEDESYRCMAACASGLGIPARMRRCGRSVLRKAGFKELFTFGTKALAAATGVPVPESEIAEVLLRSNFLPPIITTEALRSGAIESWRRHNPDAENSIIPGR